MGWMTGVQFLAGAMDSFFLPLPSDQLWSPPNLYQMDAGG